VLCYTLFDPVTFVNPLNEHRPILLSVPHASSIVPEEIRSLVRLTDKQLLEYVDLHTDKIYDIRGYHTILGSVCRVFVDTNRAPDDIAKEYEKGEEGVVVHTTQDGIPVYTTLPSEKLIEQLISKYHAPYHEHIDNLMSKIRFLFDCHSYLPIGPRMKKDAGQPRPDFNIGNRMYSACTREHTVFIRDFLEKRHYSVGINIPYMGGYILAHHCHRFRIPTFLVPGMQIEISQGLYVDQTTLDPVPDRITQMNTLMQEMVDVFFENFFTE